MLFKEDSICSKGSVGSVEGKNKLLGSNNAKT